MTFTEVMDHGAQAFEAVGACVLATGFVLSLAARTWHRSGRFLSFSLEIEMEGVPPWRRALVSGATVTRRAVEEAGGTD